MLQFTRLKLVVLTISLLVSSNIFASGGYSGGGSRGYNSAPAAKQIDQAYEYGKSIYNGRNKEVGKIKACMNNGDKLVKVKRSLIKQFKEKSYTELANGLFNCDQPDKLMADAMTREQLKYVLYYLNKRYGLELN